MSGQMRFNLRRAPCTSVPWSSLVPRFSEVAMDVQSWLVEGGFRDGMLWQGVLAWNLSNIIHPDILKVDNPCAAQCATC